MSAKTAKKARVYQSAKTRLRQGTAGIIQVQERACASQRVKLRIFLDENLKKIHSHQHCKCCS
jgi:hypothetical protein